MKTSNTKLERSVPNGRPWARPTPLLGEVTVGVMCLVLEPLLFGTVGYYPTATLVLPGVEGPFEVRVNRDSGAVSFLTEQESSNYAPVNIFEGGLPV
jgi:hypothetical protein